MDQVIQELLGGREPAANPAAQPVLDISALHHQVYNLASSVVVMGMASHATTMNVGVRRAALTDEDFHPLLASLHATAKDVEQMAVGVSGLVRELAANTAILKGLVAELQEGWPRATFLGTLGLSDLRLAVALPVEIGRSDDGVVAHAPDLEVFGTGANEYEALDDLRRVVAEEYAYLKEHESQLGPLPLRQLTRFREVLTEIGTVP